MKILSLNTWGGKLFEPLAEYLKHQSTLVDVFCFQEVFRSRVRDKESRFCTTLYSNFVRLLPRHRGIFCMLNQGHDFDRRVEYDLSEGIAIFIKKTIPARTGHFFIRLSRNAGFRTLKDDLRVPRAVQYVRIPHKRGESLIVAHTQGMYWPGDKLDTVRRLKQSKAIISGLSRLKGEKVLCGDFNLMPDTKSIRMIEEAGYRNLIREFNITDTRGPVNHALYPSPQYFADYVFVSPTVSIKRFEVPSVSVSDHLPLILTI